MARSKRKVVFVRPETHKSLMRKKTTLTLNSLDETIQYYLRQCKDLAKLDKETLGGVKDEKV